MVRSPATDGNADVLQDCISMATAPVACPYGRVATDGLKAIAHKPPKEIMKQERDRAVAYRKANEPKPIESTPCI
jgi:hypothetical protein